ncbi:hypothetical protein BN133_1247 [Cronobacter dublinensis 582]|nr:hypothetical protein BN133_1247 [Cronobacter dublinensis 582]
MAEQGKTQFGLFAAGAVTLLQVPFAFFAPAETDGAVRRDHLAAAVIKRDGFPLRIILLAQVIDQVRRAQHAACGVEAVARFQHHQHRHVGVAAHVVGEILARFVEVEFAQHHVAHRHRHGAVGALLRRQPQIAQLGDFGVVRGNGDRFGAFVAYFGKEVGVRGAGLRHVGAPGDDIAGVVPVGGFRHVGLLAPGHRRRRRQVAIPVVEAQAGAANQRQIARAGGVRHHRHRRDRREARDAVRAEGFGGPDVSRRDQFIHFLPGRTDKAAASARLLVAFCLFAVFHDGSPGVDRVAVLRFRFTPEFDQAFAHQRVFQAVGAVEIPGVAGPTRTAARLVVRHIGAGARVVGLLGFPGDETVFHVNLPAAGTGAVNAVGGADNFVMLPALTVTLFPVPVRFQQLSMPIGKGFAFLFEIAEPVQEFTHRGCSPVWSLLALWSNRHWLNLRAS